MEELKETNNNNNSGASLTSGEDGGKLQILVAGPEHEIYVDTILRPLPMLRRCAERVLPSVPMNIWPPR